MGQQNGQHVRVVPQPERFRQQALPLGYLMANSFLGQYWVLSSTFRMRPSKLLVFVTIAVATVQRAMRATCPPEMVPRVEPLSADKIGFISRRAVAAATGLPRETVRRIVNELLAEDMLTTDGRGRLANRGEILARPEVLEGLQTLLGAQARVTERLLEAGALTIEPVRA